MKQCAGSIDSKNYPLSGVMVPANFGHERPSCAQRYCFWHMEVSLYK